MCPSDEFFKDLQKDFEGRREKSKGAPKSLWEELSVRFDTRNNDVMYGKRISCSWVYVDAIILDEKSAENLSALFEGLLGLWEVEMLPSLWYLNYCNVFFATLHAKSLNKVPMQSFHMQEIGGEFVDFLESSLPEEGGRDVQNEGRSSSKEKAQSSAESNSGRKSQEETGKPKRSLDDEIDDMLSTLKKEIGKS